MIKYVITGAARSGTGYVAKLLKSAGIPCGHEAIFSHGGLEGAELNVLRQPELEADASWLAAPFLADEWLQNVTVIHLVRDPRKVVESILRVRAFIEDTPYSRFAFRHVPAMCHWQEPEDQAVCYWLAWNRMIETHAVMCRRVEDPPAQLLKVFDVEYEGSLFDDTSHNHRAEYPPIELDWMAVDVGLRRQMTELSSRYGYLQ